MKTRLPIFVSDALLLIILAVIVRIFLPILIGIAGPSNDITIAMQRDMASGGDLFVMGACLYVFIRTIQCFLYGTSESSSIFTNQSENNEHTH